MRLYAKSWLALKNNIFLLPIPMLADLLTIVLLLYFNMIYRNTTIQHYSNLFISTMQAQPAASELASIIASTLLLYTAIYIVYTLLQSASWYWSYKFCNLSHTFLNILKHYSLYNILWLVLLMAVTVLNKLLLINSTFAGVQPKLITPISGIFYFIISYFAIVSYLMQPVKTGIKKGNIIISVLFLIWVTYLVLDYFAFLSGNISQIMGIIVSMLILLPFFSWARIYLILAMKEVLK